MQNGRLVEIAEGSEVILSHQDIWVPQEGQLLALGIDGVFPNLNVRTDTKRQGDDACSLRSIPVLLAGTTVLG